MEAHYFVNDCFLTPGQLLTGAGKLAGIPGVIVQGGHDLLCPPRTAHALASVWPNARICMVEGSGHSLGEPAISEAVRQAIASFA